MLWNSEAWDSVGEACVHENMAHENALSAKLRGVMSG
jgi:hypothetical protein